MHLFYLISHTVRIEKLPKLHKRAARVITGSNYETRSTVIFEKLGWEKIEIILKKREHIMTFIKHYEVKRLITCQTFLSLVIMTRIN